MDPYEIATMTNEQIDALIKKLCTERRFREAKEDSERKHHDKTHIEN
jgi:hypothetical protein